MKKGAGIILIKDGKILLVKAKDKSLHLNGTIAIPGGHINENEAEADAARRELEEETGVTAKNLFEFPNNYVEDKIIRKDGEIEYSFKVYLVTDYSGKIKTNSDEEEPFWADLEQARKMKLWAHNNELLESALKYLNNIQL